MVWSFLILAMSLLLLSWFIWLFKTDLKHWIFSLQKYCETNCEQNCSALSFVKLVQKIWAASYFRYQFLTDDFIIFSNWERKKISELKVLIKYQKNYNQCWWLPQVISRAVDFRKLFERSLSHKKCLEKICHTIKIFADLVVLFHSFSFILVLLNLYKTRN